MNETQSVSLIIPDKYGISEENSNVIAKNCIPIIQEFNKLEIEFDLIMNEKEMSAELAKSSKSLRNKYVKVRTGGDKVIQSAKDEVQKQVEAHNQLRRDFKEEITSREDKLRDKELYFEKIEAARLDKIRQKRDHELSKYDTVYDAGDVALLDDVLYGHFFNGVKADFEEKKEAEKKAEKERIEAQRKEDLFYARKEKLIQFSQFNVQNELSSKTTEKEFIILVKKGEKLKAEFEKEQKRIKAENERLRKEAELKDKRNKELRPYIMFIRDYDKMLLLSEKDYKKEFSDIKKGAEDHWEHERQEQIRQAKQEEVDRKEKERIQKELEAKNILAIEMDKAERKRKKAEQLELIRIEEEEKAKAEQARLLELAPVKDKLKRWINELEISDPTNSRAISTNKEAFEMVEDIMKKFNSFKTWAKAEIETIK